VTEPGRRYACAPAPCGAAGEFVLDLELHATMGAGEGDHVACAVPRVVPSITRGPATWPLSRRRGDGGPAADIYALVAAVVEVIVGGARCVDNRLEVVPCPSSCAAFRVANE
jgi:hypothetical protein